VAVFRRDPQPTPASTATSRPFGAFLSDATPASGPVYNTPRALTAAAAQIRISDRDEYEQFKARRTAASSDWQAEAWEYYDAIGEIKYAFNLVAAVVSRIRMFAAAANDAAQAPTPVGETDDVDPRLAAAAERGLARLSSAYGGQPGLLRDASLNLSVVGECYLVQMPEKKGSGTPESWDIRSVDELIADQRGNFSVIGRREQNTGSGTGFGATGATAAVPLKPGAFVGRIWKNHPRYSDEADSSLRGLLDLCAELLLLNRTFRATARSRLNAGALYLPDGLSVAAQPDGDFPMDDGDMDSEAPAFTVEEAEDEFEDQLIDAMTTPIRDEESASAVVPLIIRGPAELGDKIKQFKFERSFDPQLAERSDKVLDRIMQGLDIPKDVITGMSSVKYSNALVIEESLYKTHIEPLMLLIVDSLTVVYLRPYLIANGFDKHEVERIVIWFDPSSVATRNDRAADADSGLDRNAISYSTWRRAHGFTDDDAQSPTEIAVSMLISHGSFTPELTEALLNAIAPEMMASVRTSQQATSTGPLPPEVQQALAGESAAPPAEPAAPASPATPTAPESPQP
jgi:hypothetical protein